MQQFTVTAVNRHIQPQLQQKIDHKTKPLGALGTLETIACQIGLIQQTLTPQLRQPTMLVFAGDHGIVTEAHVSPYPQAVTAQMVQNFLQGGAAINVFCDANNIKLHIIDAGVNADLPHAQLIHEKIQYGTRNYLHQPAMTLAECQRAIEAGANQVCQQVEQGCNVIGFGEMGIGNTSSASILMHKFTHLPLSDCVGRGTGLDDAGVSQKLTVLTQAVQAHPSSTNPLETLATFGGYEIAMICGGILQAAELGCVILVDGFIVTSALLVAHALHPAVTDYCLAVHCSGEQGHKHMLRHLQLDPIVDLGLRLGEGSGVAVVWPIVQTAVAFLNNMASFQSAGVSQQDDE